MEPRKKMKFKTIKGRNEKNKTKKKISPNILTYVEGTAWQKKEKNKNDNHNNEKIKRLG